MAKVVLEGVYKIYSGEQREPVVAVEDVNLTVEDREFMVFVGPSGCGKSTTLRMIAGLEEISKGKIWIGDRVVNDVAPKDRDIAMVFQNYALYPHMSVYENLAFGLRLRKLAENVIDERVREAAQILGLTDEMLRRRPKALSGGQRQRVALGRAIVRKPKVFLFDEPLSNLDAKMRVQMRTEISKLHQRLSATMIYVTHDQVEAMTMGDRITIMKHGRIQQIAEPMTLYREPANMFVAGFIGSPPMNFIYGRVIQHQGSLFFEAEDKALLLRLTEDQSARLHGHMGQKICMGIRPEHLSIDVDAGAPSLRGEVDLVESLGSENLIYLRVGKHSVIARISGSARPSEIGTLTLGVKMPQARFFSLAPEEPFFDQKKKQLDIENWQTACKLLV
ncbi:MAG: sn-glycerol-3-phosphate ABC transporter ATP-binding protein UgpC [Methylacidiphilales bacterium]|nr:sn-glycerol-3-phosphate ABC transporter ATP-binding protein UgpC [Candidatus Methylacidiphilales bacterium]MDW8348903.1 sn-glycerol-3-phosphate ABC transporter ATP-binding protein UgpC [Verrucomicrobiae bacterium]